MSATGRKDIGEEMYTTADLFKFRDDMEKKAQEKSQKYCRRLRKRRPDQLSCSVSRKTSIDSLLDEEEKENSRIFLLVAHQKENANPKLKERLDGFLRSLQSEKSEDVENNAEILREIIESFCTKYGVKPESVVSFIAPDQELNIEQLKRKFLSKSPKK